MVAARPDFTTAVAATSAVIAAIGDDQLHAHSPAYTVGDLIEPLRPSRPRG
jgi:hypothetical protein